METIWQSDADVDQLPSDVSAVPALHGLGVGDEAQFSCATWLATASFQMMDHSLPGSDAVMTLDVVRRPPDAVISWLTVT